MTNNAPEAIAPEMKFAEALRKFDEIRAERAREEGKVVVFLSHLTSDAESAHLIQEILHLYGEDKVHVCLAPDIPIGQPWREELKRNLARADWCILLYSGAAVDWSWCHEEAGAFLGMRHFATNRLAVFYPGVVPLPAFLEEFQSVRLPDITTEELEKHMEAQDNVLELEPFRPLKVFLDSFFNTDLYPRFRKINPHVLQTKEVRNNVVRKFVDAMGGMTTRTSDLQYTMRVDIPHPSDITTTFPEDTVVHPGTAGEHLFNTGNEPCSYQEFIYKMQGGDTRSATIVWESIALACKKTFDTKQLQPVFRVFREVGGLGRYRPVLTHLEVAGNKSCRFQIAFIKALEPDLPDSRESRIVTAVTMAYRIRTQLFDRYGTAAKMHNFVQEYVKNNRTNGRSDKELEVDALLEIKGVLEDILTEAMDLGIYTPHIADDFTAKEDRDWVDDTFVWWYQAQKLIDRSIQTNNREILLEIFKALEPINSAFIALAVSYVVEFVKERAEPSRILPDLTSFEEALDAEGSDPNPTAWPDPASAH
jgi:hypothetical protein